MPDGPLDSIRRLGEDDRVGTVDDYLATLDPADAAVIAGVYAIAREVVPDTEQGTSYGMPTLTYRGKGLLALKRTKHHIGMYPFSGDAIAIAAPQFAGFDLAKGTVRFSPDAPPPESAVRALVEARRAEIDG